MLAFSREVYDMLVSRARRGRPDEICGILAGSRGERAEVEGVYHAENVAADTRTNYEIDPEEQLAVMDRIEADGSEVVGFYHSHPMGPDAPSETDAADATWDGYSYVIVSLNGSHPFVGSWRWTGEAFEPEVVQLR
ncbi:M67 family metallopeptidase [Haladaptatus sp. AB618]|uniref:desampylase n=1 Tax=Haladaptatus sp. AB618 TaxID=2934173 RepID=UPI00209BC5D4|nr:desampylase [Haladaptatus sp. AB618]MCO8252802.1 M67 family metallopeptidase [Haladaptatus sp. AB618]